MDLNTIITKMTDLALVYIPKVILAIITLIIGLWIIRLLTKGMGKGLTRKKVEPTLKGFLLSLTNALLKVILFIAIIGMLGVETASFVAVLAAMGFAVGLALQGSLSNFAGGVLILLFRPIAKGEFITAQGESGTVEAIQIFTTTLLTPDNKTIIIPNGALANGNITNFSREKRRRVDLVFGIGYDDNMKDAKKILTDIVSKHKKVLKDPEPFIRVAELGDNSVNFKVRAWVESADYWGVYFDITESVKEEFDKKGIGIPYPQMDVHLHKA
ncbi:mechanosensitive ion channel protein MscS [Candidatus Woesearchaeota archaeon]|nr:MAG: mechanosensitive ion channel protein MscS [Candidatus Woesearchaeota archaeon]